MKNSFKKLIYVFTLLALFIACDQDDGYSNYENPTPILATDTDPPNQGNDPDLCEDPDDENCPD